MADLGIERTVWKPGHSRLELTLTDEHLNKGGVAHGGIHMVLLDSALGSALVASLKVEEWCACLLYTSPSPRDKRQSRMPSSA